MAKLTPKQERFIDEYLIDLNATQAAVRAGYSPKYSNSNAPKLLQITAIQVAIQKRRDELSRKAEITQERVLEEYARIAFFDPRKLLNPDGTPKPLNEIDEDTARAIAGLDIEVVGGDDGLAQVKKYKIANKLGGLDSISKQLGFFEKHNDQKKPVMFDVKFNRDER